MEGLQNASKEELIRRARRLKRQKENLESQVSRQNRRIWQLEGGFNVRPQNIIWVFGSGRTGSTWLARMLGENTKAGTEANAGGRQNGFWNEPWAGAIFEAFLEVRNRGGRGFVLSSHYRETWLESLRHLVLSGAKARFPGYAEDDVLVVKEPGGSFAAPLLTEALPESRMVLLVRDPHDVVASILDAHGEGAWMGGGGKASVEGASERFLRNVTAAKGAYDSHRGPKSFVRYEDLRAGPWGEMRRIHRELGMPEGGVGELVRKWSWEMIPEEEKGSGKKFRKASPGSWKEDLTPEQIETVEGITRPVLEAFYA